jgi:hypothetical protein
MPPSPTLADEMKALRENLPRFQSNRKADPIKVRTQFVGQRGGLQEAGG